MMKSIPDLMIENKLLRGENKNLLETIKNLRAVNGDLREKWEECKTKNKKLAMMISNLCAEAGWIPNE